MKFFIKTFGCQMNVYDSKRIDEILTKQGHVAVSTLEEAEMILVNSCTVREKPWHKAISETGRARKGKRAGKNLIVGLVGCVAQQEGDHLFELLDGVDFVVSPDNYATLPSVVNSVANEDEHLAVTGFDAPDESKFLEVGDVHDGEVSTFVTIMKGCNEHCRYCIVPSVRGPERHRSFADIKKEVSFLVSKGIKEVTLLGQQVNAYNTDGVTFADILVELDKIEGLERLRFTSPHPRHMSTEITDLFGKLPSLCESIHLPVQSGSDDVLSNMRRRYTRAEYMDVINRLRAKNPDISISTDLIIGYPGETEEDFEETLSLIKEADFTTAFSFKYSQRPGTYAAKLEDDVTPEQKQDRLSRVHEVVKSQERKFRSSLLGATCEVLIDGEGRMPNQLTGRSRNYQIVNFVCKKDINEMKGQLVNVKITRVHSNSLEGEFI